MHSSACAGTKTKMTTPDGPRRGVRHSPTDAQLVEFRKVSAEEKLRWLESVRQTLHHALSPAKKEAFQKLRRGEI